MNLTLYYNANCNDCARKTQRTRSLDWFNRVRVSTEESPIGFAPRGEIIVVEDSSQNVYTGVYATRIICMQVPVYILVWTWRSSSRPIRDIVRQRASKAATAMRAKSLNRPVRSTWCYSPRNSGRRFALNASTPSRKSAESKTRNCKLKSSSLSFSVSGSTDSCPIMIL